MIDWSTGLLIKLLSDTIRPCGNTCKTSNTCARCPLRRPRANCKENGLRSSAFQKGKQCSYPKPAFHDISRVLANSLSLLHGASDDDKSFKHAIFGTLQIKE